MDKNLDLAAEELFAKLRSQFSRVSLKDENEQPTSEPKLAREFVFDFKVKSVPLGSIRIDLSQEDGMTVMFSNDIIENQPEHIKKHWFNFIEELREFAKPKMLNFGVRNLNLSNLTKRGETQMSESKLWGGNKTSYQNLGETRIIIKHSQPVNLDIPAGRTMHIESIYIENADGERFRYPARHLNGARAMAQHISHGGNPYDEIGQYVVSLSEEMSSLRKFKGYVSRTPVVAEAMGEINSRVVERIEEIKQEIHSLQKPSYYTTFVESFVKSESKEIPEDVVNDWVDRLTIRSFNEELKNVFPYIYRLVGENVQPIKTLTLDDFKGIEEETTEEQITREIEELENFEQYLNKIIGEDANVFSKDPEQQDIAINKLKELMSQEFPVGTDGSNAIESLKEVIDDEELNDIFKELADVNPESDVRSILKDYIKIKDEENGTDVLSKIGEGEAEQPAEQPPAPEPVAQAPAEPAMPPAAPAPAAAPAMPMTPGVAMAENLKRVIEKARRAGMQLEDTFTIFGKEVTLADAIKHSGLDLNEFADQGYTDSGDDVVEFVKSMFDEDGNTPKGPTGVLLSVEKKFGEEAVEKAKHIMNELMSQAEMRRIQELSGLSVPQEEGFGDELAYGAGKLTGKIQKGVSDLANQFKAGQQAGQGMQGASGQGGQPNVPQKGQPSTPPAGQSTQPTAKKKPTNPAGPQREDSELTSMLRIAGLR